MRIEGINVDTRATSSWVFELLNITGELQYGTSGSYAWVKTSKGWTNLEQSDIEVYIILKIPTQSKIMLVDLFSFYTDMSCSSSSLLFNKNIHFPHPMNPFIYGIIKKRILLLNKNFNVMEQLIKIPSLDPYFSNLTNTWMENTQADGPSVIRSRETFYFLCRYINAWPLCYDI